MTSENDNNIKDEDLENIAGIIKFILILDNSGKEYIVIIIQKIMIQWNHN